MTIYLSRYGQRFGPYTREALETFLAEGSLIGEYWAWAPGQATWIPLRILLADLRTQSASPDGDVEEQEAAEEGPLTSGLEHAEASNPSADAPSSPDSNELKPFVDAWVVTSAKRERTAALLSGLLSRRSLAVAGLGLIAIGGLFVAAKLPEHASVAFSDRFFLRPDEGYELVDPDDPWNWQVQWVPGKPSSTQPNMLAGVEPGSWRPAPGYVWPPEGSASRGLIWVPSRREPEYPHVAAGVEPGTWVSDPGYVLAASATSTAPRAVWLKGVRLPHMESAEREGYWTLDPGYSLAADSTTESPRAAWSPGKYHYLYPHVYASPTEGTWFADPGYRWLNSDVGDLRTFNVARTQEVWRITAGIDAYTSGIDCSSDMAVLSVIEAARDRYGLLDTSEIHPVLEQHVKAVHTSLSSGATTMNTCLVVKNAEPGADLLAAGLCLLSDKPWDECMEDSATARKIIGVAGDLGSLPCAQSLKNFARSLDDLTIERRGLLNDFRAQYQLQLENPVRLVSCRQ